MLGVLLGVVCGVVEYFLLYRLTSSISGGKPIPIWVIPAKMAALGLTLVPCGFFFAAQLPYCGIAIAATLMLCAVVRFVLLRRADTKNTAADALQGGDV